MHLLHCRIMSFFSLNMINQQEIVSYAQTAVEERHTIQHTREIPTSSIQQNLVVSYAQTAVQQGHTVPQAVYNNS